MSSNKNSSNENSLVFDQQNSERANGVNSRISNLAEPSFSNGDHDDSLYDALSIDTQTPLKLEQSNANQEFELTRANINNLNSYRESLKSQDTNRFSLIDLEYIKNSKLSNNLEPRTDQTDLMLDLKETSIDEILLIADDTHTGREPISIDKQFKSKNSDNNNPRENFEFLKNSERQKKNLCASPKDFFDLNDCKTKGVGNDENQKSKTNLQRLKERINAINLNDKRLDDGLEIMKTPQPELVNDDFLEPAEPKEKSKNEGAFKLYTTSIEENVISTNRNKVPEKIETSKPQKDSKQSPFYSLDKQSICSNDVLNKSKRGPVKKYRSGSTSNLSSENKIKKPLDGRKLDNKPNSERIRPATHNEITYTLDSDESTIIDNLINNPDRLKQKLKQSRIERDQLNQLQQNYTRLLQQYAEAENFIDAFRLNAQIGGNSSNPTPVAKGSFLTNESKSQTNVGSQPNFTQPSICSSNSTLLSNQLNIDKTNSLNGSKTVLVTDQSNPFVKSISLTKAQSNDNLPKNKEFTFQSQSANNFQQAQKLNKHKSQSTVYVIPNKNSSNSGLESKSPTIDENSHIDTPPVEENIVIDQTSALGILVQIKVLEDKMQSFITLVNENQLNKLEQRQVFDSIHNDYQVLIQNFDQVNTNNSQSLVQQQDEMDVDLNEELGKMKALLDNIVHKMNDNLIDSTSDYSDLEQKQSFENSSIASFYDNRDELMGQYNRLLDFFNEEPENKSDNSNNKAGKHKSKKNEPIRSGAVCSVSRESDSESSSRSKSSKSDEHKKENNYQKKKIIESSESTSEINKKIFKNNAKIVVNRNKKDLADTLKKTTLNKKLSRISVDRVDRCENQDSDKNLSKDKKKTSVNENNNRNLNRKLTKMSNESSTETLTTSGNESTKIFSDSKPSFRSYIDEITEDTMEKSPEIKHKKILRPADKRIKEIGKQQNAHQPKMRLKMVSSKKKEFVEQPEISPSEQEYSDPDKTVRHRQDVRVMRPSPSSKKSVSIGNIYEHSKHRKQGDFKPETRTAHKQKNIDPKNLPIAKAYEGSDSLEDLDSSIPIVNDNYEYASSSVVKNDSFKRTIRPDKRTEYLQMKQRQAHKHSLNDLNHEKKKNYEHKYIKNYQQVPKIYSSKKRDDDSKFLSSDVESVIEKRKTLKTTKKDLMKKLAEEVEFLKQEILKKNKSNTSGEKKQRSDFPISDTKHQVVSDSQMSLIKEEKKNIGVPQKLVKQKISVEPKVLLQKNKNIFVLKNEHGRESYFCAIDQDDLKPKSIQVKSVCSNRGSDLKIKSIDYRDVKNHKYSSIQNLISLRRENKYLDDYFSDEELDGNFLTDPDLVSNRARSYSTKDRRYLSTNEIFERKNSNRRTDSDYLSKCPKSFSKDRGNCALVDYSIPLKKENDKNRQIPIVVGKPINKKSRECLIFLPVNNPNVINKIPVNVIPYSIKENKDDSEYELDNSIKNIINSKSSSGKYSSNQYEKPIVSSIHGSNEISSEKQSRKIRYYIREYTDISTVSDNENMYRRAYKNDDSLEKESNLNQVDLDILVDKAMVYAHSLSNNARRIRKKLYYSIF